MILKYFFLYFGRVCERLGCIGVQREGGRRSFAPLPFGHFAKDFTKRIYSSTYSPPPQFWGSKLAPAASATCNPDGKYPLDINKLLSSIIIQQNTDYPFYNLTHPWRHGYPSSGLRVPKVGLGAPPQPRYKTPSWIRPTRPSSHREEGERKYNDLTLINTTIASEFEVLERRLKVGINLLPLIFSL